MPAIPRPRWRARSASRSRGPRLYGGVPVDDALMGDGRRDATAADIRAALALYRRADAMLIGVVAVVALTLQIVLP